MKLKKSKCDKLKLWNTGDQEQLYNKYANLDFFSRVFLQFLQ